MSDVEKHGQLCHAGQRLFSSSFRNSAACSMGLGPSSQTGAEGSQAAEAAHARDGAEGKRSRNDDDKGQPQTRVSLEGGVQRLVRRRLQAILQVLAKNGRNEEDDCNLQVSSEKMEKKG